jgi:23S rRNA (cytosine1962-C5)-methyltransferase
VSSVTLRRGRAKPIWAGHPWVLSGAVAKVGGEPAPGDVVTVFDDAGRPIGRGFFAPKARITVRMLSLDPDEAIDTAFFARRVERAVDLRASLGLPDDRTTAYRLVHSEGDGLPGVVVDRYGEYLVVQLTVRGMEVHAQALAGALAAVPGVRGAVLRSVGRRSAEEGLAGEDGPFFGGAPPERIEVVENGIRHLVDTAAGQKTGHFADHRLNRAVVQSMAGGRRTLDAFTGTGGFALAAAAGGATTVLGIDSSKTSLAAAGANAAANDMANVEFVREDVFRALRRLENEKERFDLVILDPPRMASGRREVKGALRGYKELNLRAMRLLVDGGVLATASCTGMISEEEFLGAVRAAALDAKRIVTVTHVGGQGPDHPWSAAAPEGRYLKFLAGRVASAGT